MTQPPPSAPDPRAPDPAAGARVVLCTAPPEAAADLARGLVEAGLAACVNRLPGVTSVYRWEGAVQEDAEVLLVCKTTAAALPALEDHLRARHPYDVPEVVALEAAHVEPRYLAWLVGEVRSGG